MKYDALNSRNIGGAGSAAYKSDDNSSLKSLAQQSAKTHEQARNWAWADNHAYDWMDAHSPFPSSDN